MSDLIFQSQKVKSLASDASLPKGQRVLQSLQAFSGLELTKLPDDVRSRFEAGLVGVNRVFARYSLEEDEDYEAIREADLQQVLEMIDTAASQVIAAELARIVAGLYLGGGKLPVEAIREARHHRDLLVPRLIDILRQATAAVRARRVAEGNAHFFALFLLTEFQAREALPAILEAVTLPDDGPFELFEDAITESLCRVLAELATDTPEAIDELIANQSVDEYVRWAAAQTYLLWVRDGRFTRQQAVQRLREHLSDAIANRDADVASALVSELELYAPLEAIVEIHEAFRRNLVNPLDTRLDRVMQSVAEGESQFRKKLENCSPTGIQDTIAELSSWAAFQEQPRPNRDVPTGSSTLGTDDERSDPFQKEQSSQSPATIRHTASRVGRNDPCPCGSGKKFKKCCGAK